MSCQCGCGKLIHSGEAKVYLPPNDWPKQPISGKPHIAKWRGTWVVSSDEFSWHDDKYLDAIEHQEKLRRMS